MSGLTESTHCPVATPQPSIPDLLTQSNVHFIETRTLCLRRRIATLQSDAPGLDDKLAAMADVLTAPFIRLGKTYRTSPTNATTTAASRAFNLELVAARQMLASAIRDLSDSDAITPKHRRTLDRLGLRLGPVKIDPAELYAEASTQQAAAATPATASAVPAPAVASHSVKAANPSGSAVTPITPTPPAAAEAPKAVPAAPVPNAATPTPAPTANIQGPTPPRSKPYSYPNRNTKPNRFKTRAA